MAILSLFAITLLSARAFELPSASETMRDFQRRFAPLRAEVSMAMKEVVAPVSSRGVQKLSVSESSLHASPMANPLQDTEACYAAMMLPCFAGADVVGNAMGANNASEAVTLFEGFCMNCTDAAATIENVITSCNITDEAVVEMYTNIAGLLDTACEDTTCAGTVLWAFSDIEERRDSLCPNLECGLPIIEPLLSDMFVNATGDNCLSNLFEMNCLVDDEDDTVYCIDFLEQVFTDGVADMCNSSCAEDLTIVYEALIEEECGILEPLSDCDDEDIEELTLLDFCTENTAGDLCYDLLMTGDSNLTACDDVFDMVPAPSTGEIEPPTECDAECATQLMAFREVMGCCVGFALDLGCTDSVLGEFISDTCEVTYDTCVRPTLTSTLTPTDTTDGVSSIAATVASILLPAVLSMLM